MVPFDLQLIRIFLHVLAATIWVGGQFTLAGVVPTVRGFGPEATAKVARAFNRLAWPGGTDKSLSTGYLPASSVGWS